MDDELERITGRKINLTSSCRAAYKATLYIQIYIQSLKAISIFITHQYNNAYTNV